MCETLDLCVAGLRAGLDLGSVLGFAEREGPTGAALVAMLGDRRPGRTVVAGVPGLAGRGWADPTASEDTTSDPATHPATAPEREVLDVVRQAYHLSLTSGVALADAWEMAAAVLRAQQSLRRRVAVALAGPRATMRVLTLLPLAGPIIGWLFGVDPMRLYLGSSFATACLGLGVGLLVVGHWWCRVIVRRLGLGELT